MDDIKPKHHKKHRRSKSTQAKQTDTSKDKDTTPDDQESLVVPLVIPPHERHHKPEQQETRITALKSKIISIWRRLSRKQQIGLLAGSATVVIILSVGLLALLLGPNDTSEAPVIVEAEPVTLPEPQIVTSNLTGLPVDPELAKLPVTAVTIENSPEARPQAGLQEAGVVFEARVEGNITRFLALYQEEQPELIGPIRSARRNHIDWVLGFDAAFAHVGGSPFALQRIRDQNVKDLDQMRNPEGFQRRSTRFAPHNMYSSRAQLLQLHEKLGFTNSDYDSLVRKTPEPSETPDAQTVDVSMSTPQYNVRFVYDPEANAYKRFMGGVPHIDEATNEQIMVDVVVVIITDYRRSGIYSAYRGNGSGSAFIFQDGTVVEGSWEKPNRNSNFRFGDAHGAPLGLNPGKTWFTYATEKSDISIEP